MSRLEATGDSDRTVEIQAVLNEHSRVSFGPGLFVVSQLELQNNQHVSLDPRTIIKRRPGTTPGTIVLHIHNKQNVLVVGGLIDGNNVEGPREQAHCVGVEFSSDVILRNLSATRAPTQPDGGSYGDGCYLGGVTRLVMEDVLLTGNDRHGSQISHATDCVFNRVTWEKSLTDDPGSSLNLEGNDETFLMQGLHFNDCVMQGALTQGITANNHYNADWRDIVFTRCKVRDNASHGFAATGANRDDSMRFEDCTFERNGEHGLYTIGRVGLLVRGCRFYENQGVGLYSENDHRFRVVDSDFIRNGQDGLFMSRVVTAPWDGVVEGCCFFNNGTLRQDGRMNGLYTQAAYPEQVESGLRLVSNHTGNEGVYGLATQAAGFKLEGQGSRVVHMAFNDHRDNAVTDVDTGAGDNNTGGTHITLVEP